MSHITVSSPGPIRREVRVPGDKSISHRAFMFSALADGASTLRGVQKGLDVTATRGCVEALGITVEEAADGTLTVHGRGPSGFTEPGDVLDAMNSGTTMRLMSGILAGQGFLSVITGDRHLRKRPMARVLNPLREMGALALGRQEDSLAPLVLRGGQLRAIEWKMNVSSAQVKSAVLLAGLYARGTTWVEEPAKSRDHTERMLSSMGVEIFTGGTRVGIRGKQVPRPTEMTVPGDPSSAAFWGAAALMVPGSAVTVRGVALNPTRIGFFELVRRMGAEVEISQTHEAMGEPVGDITVRHSKLTGIEVTPEEVPSAIDEFPVFSVVAAVAKGETVIRGAEELRHKESDRIDAVAGELRKAGVGVETFADGMRIAGGGKLEPATFESHADHRLAMAFGVLGLAIPGGARIAGAEAAKVSYPDFWSTLLG